MRKRKKKRVVRRAMSMSAREGKKRADLKPGEHFCIICKKPTDKIIREGGFFSVICSEKCRRKRVQILCEKLELDDFSRDPKTAAALRKIKVRFRARFMTWRSEPEKEKEKMYNFYMDMAYILELLMLIHARPNNRVKFDIGKVLDEIMVSSAVEEKIKIINRRVVGFETPTLGAVA